ncbi:MAG: response regulator transcription factor [Betaproteobacteria bacterium]|nr:response regulator transcription factor [Betaproteobacteria bacterium]
MDQASILLVDDDVTLSGMLRTLLSREGWSVQVAPTGADGERMLSQACPDVALLDVMLPDANGLDLCRRWRAGNRQLAILMLTARGEPAEKVLGLDTGADDYLAKPFDRRELLARIRALLRRKAAERSDSQVLRFDGLTIDPHLREVRVRDQLVQLTSTEFKLLLELASNAGKPLTREQLNAQVQIGNYRPLDRTVDAQVYRLRRKLMPHGPGRGWIDTVRGEGYIFVPRPASAR